MTVLDASAAVAWLGDEPAADEVEPLLAGGRLTAAGVAEVVDVLVRLRGATEEEAVVALAELGLLAAIPVTEPLAIGAGVLRARHHHLRRRAVSLADCLAAEAARATGSALATTDPHLLALCHDEGIEVVVLPDSRGRRWSPE